MKNVDVTIVGAGLTGASLAIHLAQLGFQVAVLEAQDIQNSSVPRADARALALSYTTRQILTSLGVWQSISSYVSPIKAIHVSHQGHFGQCQFDANNHQYPAFGYVVPAAILTEKLRQALVAQKGVTLFSRADIIEFNYQQSVATLRIRHQDKEDTLFSQLVVAADGGQSKLRDQLNLRVKEQDYYQSALIANIQIAKDHRQIVYERLTATGPLAMLPLQNQHCGLVWSLPHERAALLRDQPAADFLQGLQAAFGYRLGKLLSISQRQCYPLRLVLTEPAIHPGIILVGNAVHALHPIAGQGFNLALRDVSALAETLAQAKRTNCALGDVNILQRYQLWRQRDQKSITFFTDTIVRLFSNKIFPLRIARSMGLFAFNLLPFARGNMVKHLMGMQTRASKTMCGLTDELTYVEE